MAINPLSGIRVARGLQLTNGKAPRMLLKSRGTVGRDQRLGRPIRRGYKRIPIKPIGMVRNRVATFSVAQPLTDAQLNVRTGLAGIGAHSRTKIW